MQLDRIMNASAYAGIGQILPQLIAIFAANDIKMIDGTGPRRRTSNVTTSCAEPALNSSR
jgi:hypothetical protein